MKEIIKNENLGEIIDIMKDLIADVERKIEQIRKHL